MMLKVIESIFLAFLFFSLLIHLYYYLVVFKKLLKYQSVDSGSSLPPASVIICARSEQHNLNEYLPFVLNQDYPEFEVVVVDDCSYDSTGEVLKEFAKKYPQLKIVTIREDEHYSHGKKLAQLVGIKGARYEHLLFTDADCKPIGKDWIKKMILHYTNDTTQIVLGYGPYQKEEGWLNKLIRFDTFYIALQYLSFAIDGKPYMGVGRNLSYKKSLFFKNKGFASHYHLESGDDDLFIGETATNNNCRITIDTDSYTFSKPKKTYSDWIDQKRRHITTGRHYRLPIKLRLALLMISQYLFFFSFLLLLIIQTNFFIAVISIVIVRYVVQMIIFSKAMKRLGEKKLLIFYPLLELQMLFFYPIFLFANAFSTRKSKWKS